MIRIDLDAGWTLRAVGGPVPSEIAATVVPATVPGTAHTDLLAAGLIPDPYQGTNEADLAWFHRAAWLYETTLRATAPAADERVDLVFDGLDTVASIALGGREVGRTANMHRGYRFDVRDLLSGEPLPLTVRFDPALEYAERIQDQIGERPHVNAHPFNAVRKMACSFGWDWGPDLQTAGIWKPARLQRWRTARLAEVRPLATLDDDGRTGRLTVHVAVERSGLGPAGDLSAHIAIGDLHAVLPLSAGSDREAVEVVVPEAPVWWPAGYGEQPLVTVTVDLFDGDEQLDTYAGRVGFRSVRLDESPDEYGHRFALVVNGRDVFVRGLNWIPEDHLLTRLTRADYEAAVDRAVETHANLLRVWGGGIYESDDFYDVCDERGVLVWQDFLLACAAYAEEEPLRGEILAEARENIARLCPHPSLALWNGGNENIWGHEDWQWKSQLDGATWGAGYYYEDFPALLAELDPTRPYHPGSPSSPGLDPADVHPNDDRYGTRHEWEAWNLRDYTWHDRSIPRFCSEFGWQAPPAWSTLTTALAPADLSKDSTAFRSHQKAEDGTGKLDRGLGAHLPVPVDFADWHWATQLNQARATTFSVTHLRAHAPRTMGSILWQLNDCWPVTSWAVVDGAGRRKPAWYALRRAYAPRFLAFHRVAGQLMIVAINDDDAPWQADGVVRRIGLDGTENASGRLRVQVAARSVQLIAPAPELLTAADVAREVLVADLDGRRATHLFAEDLNLAYRPDPLTARAERSAGGYRVTVTASSFARDVAVLADRVAPDAVCDDMLVDLLPGESHTFDIATGADVDPDAFVGPAVLRSANSLIAPAGVR
ncbi:beta-mannosidase [Actinoplanes tereljensis]|uniref:beta-mannosidase n=1 Tax=Paractinoplanes tereljensis TaxID=571912 RepID=A0A919NWS4_9ACTN|nr:glycoside hydrolase family 2 protein [Actinoplanes tereljensis]GIF26769.1 beta-mannosidase [Actinoplanes tereljensis]